MKKCAICKSMATRSYFGWGEVWLHHRCVDRAHQASQRIQEADYLEMTPGDNPATQAVVVQEGRDAQ